MTEQARLVKLNDAVKSKFSKAVNVAKRKLRLLGYSVRPLNFVTDGICVMCMCVAMCCIPLLVILQVDSAKQWNPAVIPAMRVNYARHGYYINNIYDVSRRWSIHKTCAVLGIDCERIDPIKYDDPLVHKCLNFKKFYEVSLHDEQQCSKAATHLHILNIIAKNDYHLNEKTHVMVFEDDAVLNPFYVNDSHGVIALDEVIRGGGGLVALGMRETVEPMTYSYAVTPFEASRIISNYTSWPSGGSWIANLLIANESFLNGKMLSSPCEMSPPPRRGSNVGSRGVLCESSTMDHKTRAVSPVGILRELSRTVDQKYRAKKKTHKHMRSTVKPEIVPKPHLK